MTTPENPYAYDGVAAPAREQNAPAKEFNYWQPDESVTLHDGEPIPPTMSFPYSPPAEIGRVLSAERIQHSPYFPWQGYGQLYLAANLFGLLLLFGTGSFVALLIVNLAVTLMIPVLELSFYLLAMGLVLVMSWFGRVEGQSLVTYVGTHGFAIWERSRFLRQIACHTMLFADLDRLENGVVYNKSGKQVFETSEMLFKNRNDQEIFFSHFYCQIERVWSADVVTRWKEQWQLQHRGELPLSTQLTLIFAEDLVTLKSRDQELTLSRHELKTLKLSRDGYLQLYLREQEYRIALDQIPNAYAVLTILSELCGVSLLQPKMPKVQDILIRRAPDEG